MLKSKIWVIAGLVLLAACGAKSDALEDRIIGKREGTLNGGFEKVVSFSVDTTHCIAIVTAGRGYAMSCDWGRK